MLCVASFPPLWRALGASCRCRLLWALLMCFRSVLVVCAYRPALRPDCVLQRDAMVRNASAGNNHSRKPLKAHTTNTSPPMQAYTSHRRQTPNQAAVKASNQHTTLTSRRTLCHPGTRQRHRSAAPTTGTTGSHVVHIQLKPRRRGNPPAPCAEHSVLECSFWGFPLLFARFHIFPP